MKPNPAPYLLALVLVVLAQGLYASHLNKLYYQKFGPFFDSMAYTNEMAEILTTAKEEGIGAGVAASFHGGTVSLPWLTVSLLSPVLGYSRLVGVWMQEFWLAVLAISVFFYLHRYRGAPAAVSALLSIPFLSFFAVYRHNGGVADFRMDLFLYTFLSLMAVWYLATLETSSRLPWLLSGLFLLCTILNRATAPVYMAAMFGPPLAGRFLLRKQERLLLLRRTALYWGVPFALAAAAVSVNWQFIHYYYFVWGADPNANLPLRQSLGHLLLAWKSLGPGLGAAAALMFCLQLATHWKPRHPLAMLGSVDWQLLYMGFAPALMLAAKGAGLNFLASMPCVFGWLLFAIAPVRGPLRFRTLSAIGIGAMLAVCCFYAGQGYAFHTQPGDNRIATMPALQRGLSLMRDDAIAHGKREIEFTTSHLVDFQASALRNVLVYELGAAVHKGAYRLPDGLLVRASYEGKFSPAVPLNWDQDLPGKTDDEKLAFLADVAGKSIDYYFLPDDPSIDWMEKNRPGNFINTKMRGLKAKLLASGLWQPVGEPLVASEYETVILYARR